MKLNTAAMTTVASASALIILAMAAAGFHGVNVSPSNIQICDRSGCQTFTIGQYNQLKKDLADRMEDGEPLNYDEYLTMVIVLNNEIKSNHGLNMSNVTSSAALKHGLASFLRQ